MKNPLIYSYNLVKRYPSKTILSIVLAYLYVALHEFIHYWTILYFGYQTNIRWSIFLPGMPIPPAANLIQTIFIASTPYFFSLFLIILLFIFKKNVYTKIISSIALLDFGYNIIMMPLAVAIRLPNDFRLMFAISKLWFAFMVFVWVVAFVFWWLSVVGKRGRKKV